MDVPRARSSSERSTSISGVGARPQEEQAIRTPRPLGKQAMHLTYCPDHQGAPETGQLFPTELHRLQELWYNVVVCDNHGQNRGPEKSLGRVCNLLRLCARMRPGRWNGQGS